MNWKRVAAAALSAALISAPVWAQDYPSSAIRLIVPYGAGGATDLGGRLVAAALESQLGQPVVVENLAGGSGLIGITTVAQSAPDGYTLVISTQPNQVILPAIDPAYPVDLVKGLTPIGATTGYDFFIVTNSQTPADTISEFVAYAQENPGRLSFGSAGIGTNNHFVGEMLNAVAGLDLVHVPYTRSSDALLALIAGDIDMIALDWPVLKTQIDSEGVKVLASLSDERHPELPDVPTVGEGGYDNFVFQSWQGLYGPAGLPDEVRDTLSAALIAGMADADIVSRAEPLGFILNVSTPDELIALEAEESQLWLDRAEATGIQLDN